MPLPTLDEYILARAAEMAAADGDVLGTIYVIGAAATLQTELFAARDRILAAPPVPMIVAGAAHADNVVPAPDVQAAELVAAASSDVAAATDGAAPGIAEAADENAEADGVAAQGNGTAESVA